MNKGNSMLHLLWASQCETWDFRCVFQSLYRLPSKCIHTEEAIWDSQFPREASCCCISAKPVWVVNVFEAGRQCRCSVSSHSEVKSKTAIDRWSGQDYVAKSYELELFFVYFPWIFIVPRGCFWWCIWLVQNLGQKVLLLPEKYQFIISNFPLNLIGIFMFLRGWTIFHCLHWNFEKRPCFLIILKTIFTCVATQMVKLLLV